jgi:glycosyltransferase involved in cell wall biosynthesis
MGATLVVLADFTPRGDRSLDLFFGRIGRRVREAGWPVRMLFYAPPAPEFAREIESAGVTWGTAPFPLRKAPGRFWRALAGGPVVVQSHFVSPFDPLLLLARATGRIARLQAVDHAGNLVSPKGPLMRGAERLRGVIAGRLVDEAIGVSGFVARRLVSLGLDPERVKVIHNGVDVGRWPGRSGARRPGPPRLGYAGRLHPEKGIHVMQRAFERLERRLPGVELFLAGEGPEREQLESWARGRAVHVLGTVRGLGSLFRDVDVLLAPTLVNESFGLSAAEAMCSEAAVVASDVGGLPEVLGECGRLVPRGDADALADAVVALCTDLDACAELGRRGRARVLERFTLDRAVDELARSAQALLARA